MRLVFAIAEMAMGGAESVVTELARTTSTRGDAVAVLAAPGPRDKELREMQVDRRSLPQPGRSPPRVAGAVLAATRALHCTRPELIHSHNPRITGTVAIASRLWSPLRRPVLLATHHGVAPEDTPTAARILRLADHVVCVSSDLATELQSAGVPGDKLGVIPNGVPALPPLAPERRTQLDAELDLGGSFVVATVGRLVPQKAHHRFLAAAATIAGQLVPTRFLVVGDGPLRHGLERRAHELGLTGRIHFTGPRADARDLIARSDVVVFSSKWEGLSLVALEALAAGVPVVSTDVAGMREVLSTGAGVVVAHDADSLAKAVLELLRQPQRRAAMGEEGRRLHSQRFSTARMVDLYLALYADLCVGR